jgi:hypothetical protein
MIRFKCLIAAAVFFDSEDDPDASLRFDLFFPDIHMTLLVAPSRSTMIVCQSTQKNWNEKTAEERRCITVDPP